MTLTDNDCSKSFPFAIDRGFVKDLTKDTVKCVQAIIDWHFSTNMRISMDKIKSI